MKFLLGRPLFSDVYECKKGVEIGLPIQTVPPLPLLWWGVRATLPCKLQLSEKLRCETEKAAPQRGWFTLDMWGLVSVPYSRLNAPRM